MFAAAENTLKSTSFITSVSSVNCSFTRRSGLSEPYRRIASEYGIVGNCSGSSTPITVVEHVPHHLLEDRADLDLRQERGLAVDLRELGLAVGAQVLVAEALGDLVVAVEPRDHQQLLEQLRRLRQREELAGVDARRHEVVARALGRRLGQHRRLDVDEAERVQVLADLDRDPVAQHQVVLHLRPAQVQHTVRQARRLGEVLVVELERRRDRRVQDLEFVAQHLDLAAAQVRVLGSGRPAAHLAGDLARRTRCGCARPSANMSARSGSQTTCARPSRSRRSMKITPP